MQYKVVLVSNFDNPMVDDVLFKEQLTVEEARTIAYEWNSKNASNHSRYYAQVKAQITPLYKFEP